MKPAGWKLYTLGILLFVLAVLMACGGTQGADIEGTEWSLTSLDGKDLIAGSRITLDFSADTLKGYAGCNSYGGAYSLQGNKFKIPEISSTTEDCASPEGVLDQEKAYLNILSGVDKVRFPDRNTLEMQNTARDEVLVFQRELQLSMNPSQLEGTSWALRSLDGEAMLPGTSPILSFKTDAINGSTGCRTFAATYHADGDNLQLLTLDMNEIACAKPEPYQEQENRVLDRLDDISKYQVTAEQLELITVQGDTMTYGSLPGGTIENEEGFTWILDNFSENGEVTAPLPGVEINLILPGGTIKASGKLSGSAGCTLYDANYAYDGSSFTTLSPNAPDPACDPAVNAQQQRYLGILHQVKTFDISANTLHLNTAEGQTLTFMIPGSTP